MNPEEQARVDAANQASSESQAINPQNAPNDVPAQPAPQEQPAEQPAQEETPAPPQEAPVVESEPQPAPVAAEEEYYADPVPTFNLPPIEPQAPRQVQPEQVPGLDPAQFTDEYGNVDMNRFSQAFAERDRKLVETVTQQVAQQVLNQSSQVSAQQIMAVRHEERAWKAAEKAYPEIADNKELRDLVHNTRLNYTSQGQKQISPKQAADKLFKYIKGEREAGKKEATENVRVQASAHLESAANTQSDSAVRTNEYARDIGNRDRKKSNPARENLLKEWIREGKIQI